jgi:Putative beta-barrel porin 2
MVQKGGLSLTGIDAGASTGRMLLTSGCAALLYAGIVMTAVAQSITPPPVVTGRVDVFARPGRASQALIIGDWLIYPSTFGGVVYDSNVTQSATGARCSIGTRSVPSLLAETNNDLSKTTLYGTADGRMDLNQRLGSADAMSVRSLSGGVTEIYAPLPDLLFTGQGNYTRQTDLFSTLGVTDRVFEVTDSVSTLNPTGVGLSPTTNPRSYDQFSGALSVQKNFARSFAIAGGSIVYQLSDPNTGTAASSPDGVTYTGTARGGFWITPALYGYVEGSLDSRDYATSSLSSSGYRTTVGLGIDGIGLLKEEIYTGYQSQKYQSAAIGTASGPVFGARVSYYPLPELTISLAIDQLLGASLLAATTASPAGTSTTVTSGLAKASYSIAPEWSASGRAGYIQTDYGGSLRRDQGLAIGATLTYSIWQSASLTLDCQHVALSSNVALQGCICSPR